MKIKNSKDARGGNFVVQQLLDITTPQQIDDIIDKISKDFLKLSNDKMGSLFIQKLIGKCTLPEQFEKIMGVVKNHVYELIMNQYGNYSIQSMIEWKDENTMDFLINDLLSSPTKIVEICEDDFGIIIIKSLVNEKSIKPIFDSLKGSMCELLFGKKMIYSGTFLTVLFFIEMKIREDGICCL